MWTRDEDGGQTGESGMGMVVIGHFINIINHNFWKMNSRLLTYLDY